jgi:hypothetical protein
VNRSRDLWPALTTLLALAVGIVAFADVASALRPGVVLAFLLVAPGMSLIRLLRMEDGLAELTLAVALSIALAGIVPGTMLYAGTWSPKRALVVLMGITLLATVFELGRERLRPLAARARR